jgi:MFS superfamily sulfate permease-like transporter
MDIYYILDFIEFITINVFNLAVFALFVSRVKKPEISKKIGASSLLLGIPTLIIAILNMILFREWWYWVFPMLLLGFIIFSLIVDYIKKVEFRNPRKLSILIPFLLIFYISIILMWGLTWALGTIYGIITGITYFLQLFGAYYAGKHGVG